MRDGIGFEDATQTLDALIAKLQCRVRLHNAEIESLLWSCNLLNEQKKFWHPKEYSFDRFLQKLLPDATFDKTYNIIKEK